MESGKLFAATVKVLSVCLCGCSSDSGTSYAPLFNEQGFSAIVPGMSSNQVVSLIGLPLRIDRQTVSERWRYYDSNSVVQPDKTTLFWTTGHTIAPSRGVSFDSYGGVVSQFGLDDDVLGKNREFVLRTVGNPSTIESNIANVILNYTLAKRTASHHVRAVLLDQDGNVMSKVAFYYQD